MTKQALLKKVSERVPELKELRRGKLKLIKRVIEETAQIVKRSDVLDDTETESFLKKLSKDVGTPGHFLRAYRKREGLTQVELSKKSGIRQAHISEMELGRRTIGIHSAKKLAKVLNCDYRRLV